MSQPKTKHTPKASVVFKKKSASAAYEAKDLDS
jgi:hypothetical protein